MKMKECISWFHEGENILKAFKSDKNIFQGLVEP